MDFHGLAEQARKKVCGDTTRPPGRSRPMDSHGLAEQAHKKVCGDTTRRHSAEIPREAVRR